MSAPATIAEMPPAQSRTNKSRRLRVYVMELWSFVPYYVAALCAALKETNVDVTLGSSNYHLDRRYFSKAGVETDQWLIDFGGSLRHNRLRRMVKAAEYIVNLCTLALRFLFARPDILHVQYLPFLDRGLGFELWFLRFVRHLDVRVVYTVHNVTHQDYEDRNTGLYGRVYGLADLLICHGEKAFSRLQKQFGVPAEKIQIIPHGPLYQERPLCSPAEARARLHISGHEPLVLCAGVIGEYKGIPFLLDAWKKVIESGGRGRLLIAGTGPAILLDSIRQSVTSAGLGWSVELRLEFISVEDLPLLHHAADILVYPYKAGTTSGALLTGLNYRKAIIATTLPVFQEHLRDGENAVLVPYGDEDALATALLALLGQPIYRQRLATALDERAGVTPSWTVIAEKTRECYEKLANSDPEKLANRSTSFQK